MTILAAAVGFLGILLKSERLKSRQARREAQMGRDAAEFFRRNSAELVKFHKKIDKKEKDFDEIKKIDDPAERADAYVDRHNRRVRERTTGGGGTASGAG